MKKFFLYCAFTACFLTACSSSSDNSVPDSDSESDSNEGTNSLPANESLFEDQGSVLNASNFDTVVSESVELLRADIHDRAALLLDVLATAWEPKPETIVGTSQFDCNGGGTVRRDVTTAPVIDITLLRLELVSELTLQDCVINDVAITGQIGWDWKGSSPSQLGSTSYENTYRFNDVTFTLSGNTETLTSSFVDAVTIAGPGDSFTRTATTELYQRSIGTETVTLSDASYQQNFSHFIAQPEPTNGIFHHFSETGKGTLSISNLGLSNATLQLEPELIYANQETTDSTVHTTAIASGTLTLATSANTSLVATVASAESGTLNYTLTDPSGNQTVVEREWVSPARCRGDARFNYDSCN